VLFRSYLDGRWEPSGKITPRGEDLLKKAAGFDEEASLDRGEMMTAEDWTLLSREAHPALLRGKKIVVQGTGRVGGSVLIELARYGVDIVAVADAGGAVVGAHLDPREILWAVGHSGERSCVGALKNVERVIRGAVEGREVLTMECDILLPCALETVITAKEAAVLGARLILSGGNGAVTPKAYALLHARGVPVVPDFIANAGGVVASYFEWLRNLSDRMRFEAEHLTGGAYDPGDMDRYLMPQYRDRIRGILASDESPHATVRWNALLRDIMFSMVHGAYGDALREGVPMVTTGLAGALLTTLASVLAGMPQGALLDVWRGLAPRTRGLLLSRLQHPDIRRIRPGFDPSPLDV